VIPQIAEMEFARINVQDMVFKGIAARRGEIEMDLAEASAIKLYSSRPATEGAMETVQLFGGSGCWRSTASGSRPATRRAR
jgi:hypothetical protein